MKALRSEYPLSTLCRVLEVARSSASYASRPSAPRELGELKSCILHLRVTYREFGVRRMFALLRRLGMGVSRLDVREAYDQLGILKKHPLRKVRTTNSDHAGPFFPNLVKGLEVKRPDQVWVTDVTYVRVGARFGYLALLMDVYTRQIVGWALESFLGLKLVLQALEMALSTGRHPEIHHSDRDAAYAAPDYAARFPAGKTRMSMTAADSPEDNGYAERLNRTVKEEEVYLGEYRNVDEAREGIEPYIRYYNEQRIHSSLKYQTPSEVLREWIDDQRRRT